MTKSTNNKPRRDEAASQAASLLGKRGWQARLKKYGRKRVSQMLSAAGKTAKNSGRPRLPDDKVKPATLYQRERRAKLRAAGKLKKGVRKHGKTS